MSLTAASDGTGFLWSPGLVTVEEEYSGITLGVAGYLPFNDKVRGIGRAGVLLWDYEAVATDSGIGAVPFSDDGTDLYFGIGVEASVNKSLAFNLGFTRYSSDDTDGDVIDIGIKYRLGQ